MQCVVAHTFDPGQRQVARCEFKTSLVHYIVRLCLKT